jgi:hypothetical protein
MIRSVMRTTTAELLGDPQQTRYSSTRYNTALDRAQEQFAMDSKALWADTSFTTSAGTSTQSLPSDFMYEDWVTYDSQELTPISRHDLQRLYGSTWVDRQGTPTHYIIDPEEAVKQIKLWPTPVEAKTVVLRYYPSPAAMGSDSSIPLNSSALMAQFHLGLCGFAGWLLLTSEQMTPAILEKRRELMRMYTDAVNKAISSFKNTASAGIKIRGTRLWS